MEQKDYLALADLLFPNIVQNVDFYEQKYPVRGVDFVSRFAPSPTGFMHIGGIYTSLLAERFVHQNGGIFFLRLEDTDKKREIEGAVKGIVDALNKFGIQVDEGPTDDNGNEIGNYGPYTQSHREEIYKTFVKDLVKKGKAYPCFMSEQELNEIRETQQAGKQVPGIYGRYSKRRDASLDEVKVMIEKGEKFVIRFKSEGKQSERVIVKDELRGELEMNANFVDIVLLKSTGMPTYHFAHVVDDYLMHSTHIIRADERLPSLPLHYQLFEAIEKPIPKFVHISPLLKIEGNSKRKLSKRKDPEANIEYYFQNGYPIESLIDYLFGIMDSSYEDWKKNNFDKTYKDFKLEISRLPISGALLSMEKLDSISNEYLSRISTQELYDLGLDWTQQYDKEIFELMKKYPEFTINALNIERHIEKDPKRFTRFTDLRKQLVMFYDQTYSNLIKPNLPENINKDVLRKISEFYKSSYDEKFTKEEWFDMMKDFASKNNFAINNQEFKTGNFIGKVGDIAMVLRIVLLGSQTTPDLYESMKVLGKEKIIERLKMLD